MKVLIIGDTDIDGTGAATIIRWYYQCKYTWIQRKFLRLQIETMFPDRTDLNKLFEDSEWVEWAYDNYDVVYLCDTGLNTEKGNDYLGQILAPKTIYFDHHETNYKRQEKYMKEFKAFYVKEGARCTAKIAYDVLLKKFEDPGSIWKTRKYNKFLKIKEFAQLVNDIDMWIRKYPRSTQLADVVTELGPDIAHKIFNEICLDPHKDLPQSTKAWVAAEKKKAASKELGESTLVKHRNYKVPFYTAVVDGYQSEVASALVHPRGMIAVFNLSTKTISFRIGSDYSGMKYSRNKNLSCLDFAELFGGGGHPMAAGISPEDTLSILKEMSRSMGHFILEEEKNERKTKRSSGSPAERGGTESDDRNSQRDSDKS